jgi:hypothetical protein
LVFGLVVGLIGGNWRSWPDISENGVLFGAIIVSIAIIVTGALVCVFSVTFSLSKAADQAAGDLTAAKTYIEHARITEERIESRLRRRPTTAA